MGDQAYEAIRKSIVEGSFKMGEHLVETDLSSELEMSRAPIREALKRLASEGLVVERAHHGSYVTEFSGDDIRDLYNVRVGLEVTALRLFMLRGAETEPLWREIERMERAAASSDMSRLVTAEFRFHRYIAENSGNSFVRRWFSDLEGPLMLVMALDDATFDDVDEVAAEHIPVVKSIESGDDTLACRTFHIHIMSTVGNLLQRLGSDTSGLLKPVGRGKPAARERSIPC